ncbi:hypothetical protein M3Y99_00612600 [Aphelenchoides fujianensis]|nr:hypothetical protein M3Y99_00612600 [Aphelenchoides fujianensis]
MVVAEQDISLRYEAVVYEYSNDRKLTFIPVTFNPKGAAKYTCRDCYRIFSVLTAVRSRLDNLQCWKLDELTAETDPLSFTHYCAHSDALTPQQLKYFGEYAWHFDNNDRGDNILDLAFAIGRFTKNLCSIDDKLVKFCSDNEGTDPQVLRAYVMRLDYTVNDQNHADSFIQSFKELHKDEIKYKDDLLYFEALPDSQDSGFSESPPLSVSSQPARPKKRKISASQPVQSLQQPWNAPKAKASKPRILQRASSVSAPGFKYAAPSTKFTPTPLPLPSPPQEVKEFDENLDLEQFITGLILSAMNMVKTPELHALCNALRPLVIAYAPNSLTQFMSMIHTIDHRMRAQRAGAASSAQNGAMNVHTFNDSPGQLPISPTSAFHSPSQLSANGTSANPIVVGEDPIDEKPRLVNGAVKQEE